MKRIFWAVCLLSLLLAVNVFADDQWSFWVGSSGGPVSYACHGYTDADAYPVYPPGAYAFVVDASNTPVGAYNQDFLLLDGPNWDIYMAATPTFSKSSMTFTLGVGGLYPGVPSKNNWKLRLVDAKGWSAPQTVLDLDSLLVGANDGDTLLTISNIPVIKCNIPGSLVDQGYHFQIFNSVPEPSSLIAMGSGLLGLVGYAIRRRRA